MEERGYRRSDTFPLKFYAQPCSAGLTDNNIRTAFDHRADTAAMGGSVAKAHRRNVVDEDSRAAGSGFPGIGSATQGMPSGIANAKRLSVVDKDIGGTLGCRADHHVRAARLAVDTYGAE